MAKLVKLSVVQNATQDKVSGDSNWATVRKDDQKGSEIIVEAATGPKNNTDEWKQIKWDGPGAAIQGQGNRRSLSRAASKVLTVKASLESTTLTVNIWVIWANVQILMKGFRPSHAAPYDPGTRDESEKLGAVTYKQPLITTIIDEDKGEFADTMGASAKVSPVATLSPAGIFKVVQSGWAFRREVWSHNWSDGVPTDQFNNNWTNDTSNKKYLRLTPDSDDKIYDLDAPDIRWGTRSYETYNNFRQWIEWNNERCSDNAPWYWQARWHADRDINKQVSLNDCGTGNITIPSKPVFPPKK